MARTVGPAQIMPETAIREKVMDEAMLSSYALVCQWQGSLSGSPGDYARGYLSTDKGSIDTSAALIRKYLEAMGSAYKAGTMSPVFLGGAGIVEPDVEFGRSTRPPSLVNAPVSEGLLRGMGMAYNYGIDVIKAQPAAALTLRWREAASQGARVAAMGVYFAP